MSEQIPTFGLPVDPEFSASAAWHDMYHQLKGIARRRLDRFQIGATLSATALVHEAFLKISAAEGRDFRNQGHFLAVSSLAMRQILIEYLRQKAALKRGLPAVTFDDFAGDGSAPALDPLALDELLVQLQHDDALMVQIVVARIYGGFAFEEIAAALALNRRTVHRKWTKAKVLILHRFGVAGNDTADDEAAL